MSGLVHPDQNVRNATQNSLCRAVNRRRGCCACRASNCRRRARFSRTRSSRERKALTIQPRKCRSDAIIAGIISEKSESSFAPSHSFCRCTRFWRGTTRFAIHCRTGWRSLNARLSRNLLISPFKSRNRLRRASIIVLATRRRRSQGLLPGSVPMSAICGQIRS